VKKKAFTLIELMVAIGLLAIVMVMAGAIFRAAIDAYRMAKANGEVIRNYRTIVNQLDRDLQGLRKEGEILVIWGAYPDANVPDTEAGYARCDRIMFFAAGDFQSSGYDPNVPDVHGNLARISYALAKRYDPVGRAYRDPATTPPRRRILARTQHILVVEPIENDKGYVDPNQLTSNDPRWFRWHNRQQYDVTTLLGWKRMLAQGHDDALSVIADVSIGEPGTTSQVPPDRRGAQVDPCDPNALHMLLSEGVGQFAVQGWYDPAGRWVPQLDINGNGKMQQDDTDFLPSKDGLVRYSSPLGLLYRGNGEGWVVLGGPLKDAYQGPFDPDHFTQIPGLGRALKFTFTLYDSKGILPKGRTFTHIVDLDD